MTAPDSERAGEPAVLHVASREEWARWLEAEHASSPGVWLRLGKKGGGVATPSYAEALEEALCYGWIDAQKKGADAASWIQRFTPRGRRSIWSKVNREKVEALIATGRMRPAGLEAVERARADGRWERAYDPPSSATVPPDFQAALDASPVARDAFAALDRQNRYAMLFRIQTVKRAETRARHIERFVGMLERGERIHP